MGVVCRLVSNRVLRQLDAEQPGRAAVRPSEGDEGRLVSLPRILLQSLSGRRTHLEHSGQLRLEHRLSLRKKSNLTCAAMLALCCCVPSNAATVCDARAYGAKADGKSKDTAALQKAIDDCARKGGGTVHLAKGTFLTGPIALKSHITLQIEPGATLLGSQDKSDYQKITVMREDAVQPLISAVNAQDIAIRGGGVIDGSGEPWWTEVYAHKNSPEYVAAKRPRLILIDHTKHVRIEGVTIQNSASWQVTLYYADEVIIRDGKILAPEHSPNTDGVDPFSSHHVTISYMTIDVGDDNVAIKSGQPGSPGPDDPSTDIDVSDCTFLHGHGMSIGSEVAGGVQNVRVSRVQFKGTANGVRVKSNRDRGADIGHLDFRDLTMEDVATPVLVTEYYPRIPDRDSAQPVTRLTPRFHDISITNLSATGAKNGGFIVGLPESPITSISLTNVHISAEKGMTISNSTVTAYDFAVKVTSGDPLILLEHAKVEQK
jgi:polygalacturonase